MKKFLKVLHFLSIFIISFKVSDLYSQTTKYAYSKTTQTYTIPSGVSKINIKAVGASGQKATTPVTFRYGFYPPDTNPNELNLDKVPANRVTIIDVYVNSGGDLGTLFTFPMRDIEAPNGNIIKKDGAEEGDTIQINMHLVGYTVSRGLESYSAQIKQYYWNGFTYRESNPITLATLKDNKFYLFKLVGYQWVLVSNPISSGPLYDDIGGEIPGYGALVSGEVQVKPGDRLEITTGGRDGFNGGGLGGAGDGLFYNLLSSSGKRDFKSSSLKSGGNGGGATTVELISEGQRKTVVVAAGGGGYGGSLGLFDIPVSQLRGQGASASQNGGNAQLSYYDSRPSSLANRVFLGGFGGSATSGGRGGIGYDITSRGESMARTGLPGRKAVGGQGAAGYGSGGGGGGGGGYYGGGGGATTIRESTQIKEAFSVSGGGGGGSSYADPVLVRNAIFAEDQIFRDGSVLISVAQKSQTISSFNQIEQKILGSGGFQINPPSSTSGLPVSISIKSGPATISGNTITLTGAGIVVLAANQSGNADFAAAPEVTTSFNVAGASQTISAFTAIPAKSFGTSPFNLSAPSSNSNLPVALSVKSGPATITGNAVTLTGVGTVVLAANQAGNTNFGPASEVTTSFVVNKGSQTIGVFAPVGAKAFGSAFSVIPPTASSGLPVVLSVKSGPATITANNTVTPTGLGTVVLAANQSGNVNYNAAPEVTTSFVVGKGNQTISAFAAIGPKLVGASPFVISAPSASSALPVVLTIKSGPATISTNRTVAITGPGNVTIAANQSGNANFHRAPEVTTTFLVTRPLSTLTVTVPAANEGTVTLGFAGATTREIGANYTVTAIPASGMMSKGWRKGNATLSANATLNFVMEANMQLMPLFAPDFSKLAGTYNGLVGNGDIGTGAAKDMQSFPLKNGFVTFSLGSTGALSGNLSIDGQTSRFTGNLSTNRTAAITIAGANKTSAQASLQLTPALPGEISGNITVSGEALSFRALRAAYTIGTAAHALGGRTYTLAIPAPSGLALGHGFARVAIQKNGLATATGRLATGDAISAFAGFVDSGDGNWVMPVYSTGNGIFTGEIVIPKTPSINSAELFGSFEWLRPANAASPLFPAGFLGRTNVAGTRYSISTGNSLLSGNRTATGFTLNIDSQRALLPTAIAQKGTWPSNNTPAFVQPISSGLQMTFSSANGSVQGVFNRTINGRQVPTAFQGVMFGKPVSTGNGRPMLRGAGYFISGNRSVPVEISVP